MLKKICRTIKLRKFKSEVIVKESLDKFANHEFIVCFEDNKWTLACDKWDLRRLLEKDHIRPICYIFDLTDRISIDRDVLINTNLKEEDD